MTRSILALCALLALTGPALADGVPVSDAGTGQPGDPAWSGSGPATNNSILQYIAAKAAAMLAQTPTLNGDGGSPAHVTNWPATQPISAASLPLPSGAALDSSLQSILAKETAIQALLGGNLSVTLTGSTAFTPSPSGQSQNGITAVVPSVASGCAILKGASGNFFSTSVYTSAGGWVMVLDTAAAPADSTVIPASSPPATFLLAPVQVAAGATWNAPPLPFPYAANNGVVVCVSTSATTKTAVSGALVITGQAE
jgi:hypothetical protein